VNVALNLAGWRRAAPERPALLAEGRASTYRELDEQSGRLAAALGSLGVRRGDRVALYLPNLPEFAVAYYAALKRGAIAVSVSAAARGEELAYMLADSGASVLFTTVEFHRNLTAPARAGLRHVVLVRDGLWREVAGETLRLSELVASFAEEPAVAVAAAEPAAIVYTSGTTGLAKGAALSHGNVLSNVRAKERYLGIRPEDRLLLFLPLHHCFGQNAILNAALGAGATAVIEQGFDLERILASVAENRVTMFFGIPTTYILLLERATPADLAGVRYFFSAAASLPREVERRWRERFGRPIFQGYGLTETSPFASYNDDPVAHPGSIGRPISGVEMKVVDVFDRRDLPPGERGEILIKGENVMLGYWGRSAETEAVLKDGWLASGDVGWMAEGRWFYLEDRLKDMVNVSGLKVYPAEVENVLLRLPAIREAAVYGVPDALLGERVEVAVVLREEGGMTETEILAFCRSQIADYKAPGRVVFLPELPKNRSGKVLKRVLREQAAAPADTADGHPRTVSAVSVGAARDWLSSWLGRHLAPASGVSERLPAEATFFDLGLTSILAVQLATDLNRWLGRDLPSTLVWSFSTLEALARHLAGEEPEDDLSHLSEGALASLLAAEIAAAKKVP
jgi:long-chain acyl-CoA synthetase